MQQKPFHPTSRCPSVISPSLCLHPQAATHLSVYGFVCAFEFYRRGSTQHFVGLASDLARLPHGLPCGWELVHLKDIWVAPSLGLSEGTWIQAWGCDACCTRECRAACQGVLDFKKVLKDRLP